MAASIEALYIVLGYSNIEIRPSPLSLDKYHKSTCSYNIHQPGKVLNTRSSEVGVTEEKRIKWLLSCLIGLIRKESVLHYSMV